MFSINSIGFLTGVCIIVDVISLILFIKGRKEGILALIVSIFTTLISWGMLDIPSPEIFPVSELVQDRPYEVIITSEDNLEIYYTLDGSDPKQGIRYQGPLEMEESATVAARTRYMFAWSDIKKITYNVDTASGTLPEKEDENEIQHNEVSKDSNEQENQTIDEEDVDSSNVENKGEVAYYQFAGENHTPNGPAEIVEVSTWQKDKDYAIDGTTYDGGIKVYISYMISSFFGNDAGTSKDFTSEIHLALNQDAVETLPVEKQKFSGKIVINKETEGSPSTAVVSILVDGEELYNSGEFDCYSLDIPEFSVDVSGKKEIIIKTICHQSGNPFVFGIVNRD